jgi:hypothetical protein
MHNPHYSLGVILILDEKKTVNITKVITYYYFCLSAKCLRVRARVRFRIRGLCIGIGLRFEG